MATKKTAAAKETAVKETKETVVKEVKAPAKKAAEKAVEKTVAEKKPAAKKTTAKTAVKESVYVQFMGNEVNTADVMKKVKENWTKVLKNKVGDMKTVDLYIKLEEGKAYFVINGDVTGAVEL